MCVVSFYVDYYESPQPSRFAFNTVFYVVVRSTVITHTVQGSVQYYAAAQLQPANFSAH